MEKTPLRRADAPVRQALILICEKCGKKLTDSEDSDKNPARRLQKDLKYEMGERFGKRAARAVISSCLNICPQDEIAIGICEIEGPSEFYTFSLNEEDAVKTEILNLVGEMVSQK